MIAQNTISKTILFISILAILSIIAFLYHAITTFDFPDFYTREDRMHEYTSLLYHLPVIIPAILGFWISKKSPIKPFIFYGYVVYALTLILSYYTAITASDPIGAGIFFIVLLIPFSIIFSIILFINLKK